MNSKSVIAIFVGMAAAAALLSGCSYAADDKAVLNEYYDHIEYLNRPSENADPGSRYRIAREFFEEVNFEGIKDKSLLLKLLGKPTKITGGADSQILEYSFVSSSDGNPIDATFRCEGNRVVSAKIVGP